MHSIYNPSHFAESRPEVLGALIAAHPLATLVTLSQGQLVANYIPLLLRHDDPGAGRHLDTSANHHWQIESEGK